jgi:hypothetical protein
MEMLIEWAIESFQHVDDAGKTGGFKRYSGFDRTPAAAANQQNRAVQITFDQPLDLVGERRVDLPIQPFLPGNVLGTYRMTDVHMLGFCPTIDQHGVSPLLKKGIRGAGGEVLHRYIHKLGSAHIMKASL